MKRIRNEYRELKKENDLLSSTLAECDRDAITDIVNTISNTCGINYEVELVRKDLIAMAANAEADGQFLSAVIGDREIFKRDLLASMPRPKFADYMADSLVWLALYSLAVSVTHLLFEGPWACYYDVTWLALCIVIMMPSAWLLQRIVPAEWAASVRTGAQYGASVAATLVLWFAEFWCIYHWIVPRLPAAGLPNLVAVVLFAAASAALWAWRNHRRNEMAEKRPWRDVIEK